jgi:hypothetical protein
VSKITPTEKNTIQAKNLEDVENSVTRLIEIRDYFNQIVVDSNVSISDLKEAYIEEDEASIKSLLGLSQEDVDEFDAELVSLRNTIVSSDPETYGSGECSGCDSEENITYFYGNYGPLTSVGSVATGDPNWPAYVACLVVCTTTGPFIYWACAYLCYDS